MLRKYSNAIAAVLLTASSTNCDPAADIEHDEEALVAASESAAEPEALQHDSDVADGPRSSEERELLWLTRSLYRRHLAGYPGGPSPFEQRFAAALAEGGGVSDDYFEGYCDQIDVLLADDPAAQGLEVDSPVDGARLGELLLADSDAQDSTLAFDVATPLDPALAGSLRYRFKVESVTMHFCSTENGACSQEEPFVAWCFFWPGGETCGVTAQTTTVFTEEKVLTGTTSALTPLDPSSVMAFYQIVDGDDTFNAQKYKDALTTIKALIKSSGVNWPALTSVPSSFKSYWNQSINSIKGNDDPYPLIADMYKLADLQARTAMSGKFLSDCLATKKFSLCAGNYSLQSVVPKVVSGSWPWTATLSISAQP